MRQRPRLTSALLATVALVLCASSFSIVDQSGASTTTTIVKHAHPYKIGSSILALKLTRMEMLTSRVGVGVAPIVTYSGGLVRAYLVRTDDAGKTWTVTGIFPRGTYPWTTAFASPQEGYVVDSSGVLFTNNAGRTWTKVLTSYSPLTISLKGRIVWITVENYCSTASTKHPCGTYLDSYKLGGLVPLRVSRLPSIQPSVSQVAPTQGYAGGSGNVAGTIYYTSNSGASWRSIATPCGRHHVSEGSVVLLSRLAIYCELGALNSPGPTILYKSADEGATWQLIPDVKTLGLNAASGSTGKFLWDFGENAVLSESSDGGLQWVMVPSVKYGTNDVIATYGAHDAWHVLTGKGIYRTLNGRTWQLLK